MPMAATLPSPTHHAPRNPIINSTMTNVITHAVPQEDTVLGWLSAEFAAANAIIDVLCSHLAHLNGGGSEYLNVFAAIRMRRLNWNPLLQKQNYYSIADVALELQKVTENNVRFFHGGCVKKRADEAKECDDEAKVCLDEKEQVDDTVMKIGENVTGGNGNEAQQVVDQDEDSADSEITDSGSRGQDPISVYKDMCTNHEGCKTRTSQIKLSKSFSAKEQVKGHLVNVVKGLKLYEEIFTHSELSKLTEFVHELQSAGQNGDLSGNTYILFNQRMKGNRREMIQFGVPLFGHIKEEAAYSNELRNIEPIPALLGSVIDHLVQWQLIPENKTPNGCIIRFFQEGEHSQPFQKPPHLDHPMATLFLSESTMAFGHMLVNDNDGNYKGPLTLSLKEGSVLVMRGNSADIAGHVMCSHPNKRVSITFFRCKPLKPSVTAAMTQCQSVVAKPYPYELQHGIKTADLMPEWAVHMPLAMLVPTPYLMSKLPNGGTATGTGVFLPCTAKSRNSRKQRVPPRARKAQCLDMSSPVQAEAEAEAEAPCQSDKDSSSKSSITI